MTLGFGSQGDPAHALMSHFSHCIEETFNTNNDKLVRMWRKGGRGGGGGFLKLRNGPEEAQQEHIERRESICNIFQSFHTPACLIQKVIYRQKTDTDSFQTSLASGHIQCFHIKISNCFHLIIRKYTCNLK